MPRYNTQHDMSLDAIIRDLRDRVRKLEAMGSPTDLVGSGSPEGVYDARRGSTFRRLDGGAGTCFYVKESDSGSTGWVAK